MSPLSFCACLLLCTIVLSSLSYSIAVLCWLLSQFSCTDGIAYRSKSRKTTTLFLPPPTLLLSNTLLSSFLFCTLGCFFNCDLLLEMIIWSSNITDFTNHISVYGLESFSGCISQPHPLSWQYYWFDWNSALCNQIRFPSRIIMRVLVST